MPLRGLVLYTLPRKSGHTDTAPETPPAYQLLILGEDRWHLDLVTPIPLRAWRDAAVSGLSPFTSCWTWELTILF